MKDRLMMRDRLIAQASDRVVSAHESLWEMLSDAPELESSERFQEAVALLGQAMHLITEAYEV